MELVLIDYSGLKFFSSGVPGFKLNYNGFIFEEEKHYFKNLIKMKIFS